MSEPSEQTKGLLALCDPNTECWSAEERAMNRIAAQASRQADALEERNRIASVEVQMLEKLAEAMILVGKTLVSK